MAQPDEQQRQFLTELRDLLARYPVKIEAGYNDEIGSVASIRFYNAHPDGGTIVTGFDAEEWDESECDYVLSPNYALDSGEY